MTSIQFGLLHAIEKTITDGMNSGALLGFPMLKTKVIILDGKYSESRTNETAVQMLTAQLLKELIKEAEPTLLEPVAEMDISTPSELSSLLMNDIISNKRGRIVEMREEEGRFGREGMRRNNLNAIVPVVETIGYSTHIRSISKVLSIQLSR